MLLVVTLLFLFYVCAIRGAMLAMGKKKFFKKENFLLYQKIAALLLAPLLIMFGLSNQWYLFFLTIANYLLLGAFYLQPTPRTTKSIAILFIIVHLFFIAYRFF